MQHQQQRQQHLDQLSNKSPQFIFHIRSELFCFVWLPCLVLFCVCGKFENQLRAFSIVISHGKTISFTIEFQVLTETEKERERQITSSRNLGNVATQSRVLLDQRIVTKCVVPSPVRVIIVLGGGSKIRYIIIEYIFRKSRAIIIVGRL